MLRAGKRPDVIHCHDWQTGLGRPDYFLDADRLGDDFRYRGLNPMKGGILYSNFVTTVSPNYADEALYDDGGCGLGGTLKEQQDKFRGILSGVDYAAWSPDTDPYLRPATRPAP